MPLNAVERLGEIRKRGEFLERHGVAHLLRWVVELDGHLRTDSCVMVLAVKAKMMGESDHLPRCLTAAVKVVVSVLDPLRLLSKLR